MNEGGRWSHPAESRLSALRFSSCIMTSTPWLTFLRFFLKPGSLYTLPSMSQLACHNSKTDMKQKTSKNITGITGSIDATKHNSMVPMVQRQGSLEPVHFQPLAARHRRADSWFQQAVGLSGCRVVGLSVHTPPFENMTGLGVQKTKTENRDLHSLPWSNMEPLLYGRFWDLFSWILFFMEITPSCSGCSICQDSYGNGEPTMGSGCFKGNTPYEPLVLWTAIIHHHHHHHHHHHPRNLFFKKGKLYL